MPIVFIRSKDTPEILKEERSHGDESRKWKASSTNQQALNLANDHQKPEKGKKRFVSVACRGYVALFTGLVQVSGFQA